MIAGYADLDALPRKNLLAVAYDYMHSGMIASRASRGPLAALGDRVPESDMLSIPQWMGASPVYTRRLRRLFGIEGDDVVAILKALQLDVGFVHQYMDVAYKVTDPKHAEFWLLHCGALMDVEPFGEERVRHMCHTIEDPTFDATALATNPRARIRPIHRPPRSPADRQPHCHWTVIIDDENEPVGSNSQTDRVDALALSSVPNEIGPAVEGRLHDYSGPLELAFRLDALTNGALAAAAREFQMQAHLLVASMHLAVADRTDEELSRGVTDDGWLAFGWILAERLARVADLGERVDRVAAALALTPAFPPGFDRTVEATGDHVEIRFEPTHDGIGDPDHPGCVGSLARGVTTGVQGTVCGLGFEPESLEARRHGSTIVYGFDVAPAAPDRKVPGAVAIGQIGKAASWSFDVPRVDR